MNWGKFHPLPKLAHNGSLTIVQVILNPTNFLGLPVFNNIASAGKFSTLPNLVPSSGMKIKKA
jgi:hypothetical protein